MKTQKYPYLIGWLICTLVVVAFVIIKNNEGSYTESVDYKVRVSQLKKIYRHYLDFNKRNPNKNISLYLIYKTQVSSHDFLMYKGDSASIEKMLYCNEPEFYKLCDYALIKDDFEWWGILERKKGVKGDYYLMITSEGKVIKIKDIFLPAQIYEKVKFNN
ncbi:MAG: hypothetical protein JXR78_07705 [Victivallales bacterium]|nr:hypothetical protein [Victivallales bacterium]